MVAPKGNKCGKCKKPKGTGDGACRCGRPTTYLPEYVGKVDEYLKISEDQYIQSVTKNAITGKKEILRRFVVQLPTRGGLAIFLHTTLTALDSWSKKNPEFQVALEKLAKVQERRLLNSGLSGEYNSTIAKLILSSNHGYAEKTHQEHSGEITVNAEKQKAIQNALSDT